MMTRKSNILVLEKYENGRMYAVPLVEKEKLPTCQVCFEEFQSHPELSHHYSSSHPEYRAGEPSNHGSSSKASCSISSAASTQSSGSSRPECQGVDAAGIDPVSEPILSGPSSPASVSAQQYEQYEMECQGGDSASDAQRSSPILTSPPSASIQQVGPSQIGYQVEAPVANLLPSPPAMVNPPPTVVQPAPSHVAMPAAQLGSDMYYHTMSPTNNNFPASAVTGQPMSSISHQPIPAGDYMPMDIPGPLEQSYPAEMAYGSAPGGSPTDTSSPLQGGENNLIVDSNGNVSPTTGTLHVQHTSSGTTVTLSWDGIHSQWVVPQIQWRPTSPPRPGAPPPTPMGSLPEHNMETNSIPPAMQSTGGQAASQDWAPVPASQPSVSPMAAPSVAPLAVPSTVPVNSGNQNYGGIQIPVSPRGLVNPCAADPSDVQWTTTSKTLRKNLSIVNKNTPFYHIDESEKRLFRASEMGVNIKDQRRWHDMDIYLTREQDPLVAHARLYERGKTRIIFLDEPSVYILALWLTKNSEISIPESGKCCIQEYPDTWPGKPTLWFSRQHLMT